MKLPNNRYKYLYVLAVVLIALLVFLIFTFSTNPTSIKKEVSEVLPLPVENIATVLVKESVTSGIPIRLKIPTISVDASVEKVGILPSGIMDIPKSPDNVSWFEPGIRPGDIGSSVIAGHFGRKNGKGSVFDNIDKLKKGDKLSIEDDKGATINFVVQEIKLYDPKADTSEVFVSSDNRSHLNLITCEGIWNKILIGYPKRLVVFTDKE